MNDSGIIMTHDRRYAMRGQRNVLSIYASVNTNGARIMPCMYHTHLTP